MKKAIAVVLAISSVLIFIMFPTASSATSFSSITSSSIKAKEEQISQAADEKEKLQNSLTNVKNIKQQLETEKKNLNNYVKQLDAQLQAIQDNIAQLNVQIKQKEDEIAATQEELRKARETEEAQYAAMVSRIQFMYEQGESTFFDLIFTGESISDILNKVEYMEQISAYDRRQLDEYMLNRQLIELCEQELLLQKEVLDQTREGVLEEEAAMEELIAAKRQTIEEYETDINNKEQAIQEYEDDIQEQTEIIEALEAAVTAERKSILAANGIVLSYDGGQFKFPVASYTRVSSPYGMRLHPTLKVDKFHNGIDLASPKGTAIYAAYDGIVVAASYSTSMGNYVMIDHGDNLYTIYMHASKLYVKEDDVVARGETIAAVGSTGRSTGPHLHFGVRKDGEYVDPTTYLSK